MLEGSFEWFESGRLSIMSFIRTDVDGSLMETRRYSPWFDRTNENFDYAHSQSQRGWTLRATVLVSGGSLETCKHGDVSPLPSLLHP